MVRFIRCNFTGGKDGSAGGGIDVDTSFVDIRLSSFKGIRAPPGPAEGSLGAGIWGGLQEEAGVAMRMGAVRWHVGGRFVAAARQRSIHRLAPQVYMATTLMEKNTGGEGGSVAVSRGTFYCQVRAPECYLVPAARCLVPGACERLALGASLLLCLQAHVSTVAG